MHKHIQKSSRVADVCSHNRQACVSHSLSLVISNVYLAPYMSNVLIEKYRIWLILMVKSYSWFEVLIAVVMKGSISWLWCRAACSKSTDFWVTCRLHLQDGRICQARNQHEEGDFLFGLFFDPDNAGDMFPSNVGLRVSSTDYTTL
jgi:hypothetical protein